MPLGIAQQHPYYGGRGTAAFTNNVDDVKLGQVTYEAAARPTAAVAGGTSASVPVQSTNTVDFPVPVSSFLPQHQQQL